MQKQLRFCGQKAMVTWLIIYRTVLSPLWLATLWGIYIITPEGQKQPGNCKYLWFLLSTLISLLRLSPATVYQNIWNNQVSKFLLFHFSFYDHKLSFLFKYASRIYSKDHPSQSSMKSKFCTCVLSTNSISGLYVLSNVQCVRKGIYVCDSPCL